MKYIIVVIFTFLLVGCTGRKASTSVTDEQKLFQIDHVDEATGLQKMQPSQFSEEIEAGGKKYQLYILEEELHHI